MIAAYIRKSPDDKKESDKIENQRKVILGYAKSNGLTISEDAFYIDDQTSGYVVDESLAFFDRKNWNRMMEDIRNKKLQMVLLKDYTRLGRRAGPFLIAVEQITKHGCKLIDCTSNSEIRPSDDRIIFDAYFSERYVRDISGKVRSLFASKQKEGSLVMNNKFGYEKNKKTGLIVNEEIRPCIELIFKLYIGGLGFEKIAQYLNDSTEYPTPSQHYENTKHEKGESCKYKTAKQWHHYHIRNIIDNRVYTGCLVTHKKETDGIRGKAIVIPESDRYFFPNHHEAIITVEDFEKAQAIRKKRAVEKLRGSADYDYIFRGFCICADCGYHAGGKMIRRKGGPVAAYNCSQYIKSGIKGCSNKEIKENALLEQFKGFLLIMREHYAEYLKSVDIKVEPSNNKKLLADSEAKLKKARSELTNLVKQQARAILNEPEETKQVLLEAYHDAEGEYKQRIVQLAALVENLKTLTGKENEQIIKSALENMDAIIECQRPDRRFIDALIDKILIHSNRTVEFILKVEISEFIRSAMKTLYVD